MYKSCKEVSHGTSALHLCRQFGQQQPGGGGSQTFDRHISKGSCDCQWRQISYFARYLKNKLTWSQFVKILCITPNISTQQIKMIKSCPCVMMNNLMLKTGYISCLLLIDVSWLKGKFSLKFGSILHKVPSMLFIWQTSL